MHEVIHVALADPVMPTPTPTPLPPPPGAFAADVDPPFAAAAPAPTLPPVLPLLLLPGKKRDHQDLSPAAAGTDSKGGAREMSHYM